MRARTLARGKLTLARALCAAGIVALALTTAAGAPAATTQEDQDFLRRIAPTLPGAEKLIDTAGIIASYVPPAGQLLDDRPLSGRMRVIVTLRATSSDRAEAFEPNGTRAARERRRAVVEAAQARALQGVDPAGCQVFKRYRQVPCFAALVDTAALTALLADPTVARIEPDRAREAHLMQGIALIGAGGARAAYRGGGLAIAIIDTGVDYNHPQLGGGGFPNAKVINGTDTAGGGDSDPFPRGSGAGMGHGTCCAGIAAGDIAAVGSYIGGVAPDARLVAVKVFADGSSIAFNSDIIQGIDWCLDHQDDDPANPILVISLSLGGDRYFSAASCDAGEPALLAAAEAAVAAGITVLASTGNDGFCDSLSSPACLSPVISVGAVYDADFGTYMPCVNAATCHPGKLATGGCATGWFVSEPSAAKKVAAYSNSSSFLDVFAPANRAFTTDLSGTGGYNAADSPAGDYNSAFGGTSAACPYVAGAVAVLQSAAKARLGRFYSPDEIRALLTSTGEAVTDSKGGGLVPGLVKPLINVQAAFEAIPLAPPVIAPEGPLVSAGPEGGPFDPACAVYTLTNTGADALAWSAASTAAWLDVTPVGGALAAGASTTVGVCVNALAGALPGAVAAYTADVIFANDTLGTTQARAALLAVAQRPPEIAVAPSSFSLTLDAGQRAERSLTIGNVAAAGAADLAFSVAVASGQPWLEVGAGSLPVSGGSLAAQSSGTIEIEVDTAGLAPGGHAGEVVVTSDDPAAELTTIPVALTVAEPPVIGVAVSPAAWAIGPLGLGESAGATTFTATVGNVTTRLEIRGDDGAGGWAIATAAGVERFAAAVSSGGDGGAVTTLTAGYQELSSAAPAGSAIEFALTYHAPTSDTLAAELDQGFAIVLRASAASVGSGIATVADAPLATTAAIQVQVWRRAPLPPWVELDTPATTQSGEIGIAYRLYDEESRRLDVGVDFLTGGVAWTSATLSAGGDGVSQLAASPEGTSHTLCWNSLADLGAGTHSAARLRVTPIIDGATGVVAETDDFAVVNPSSAEVVEYLLGASGASALLDVNHDGRIDAGDLLLLLASGL